MYNNIGTTGQPPSSCNFQRHYVIENTFSYCKFSFLIKNIKKQTMYTPCVRFYKQWMWRGVVPTTQSPVERFCARAEVHELDHRMGEKQSGHHSSGQLICIVGLGDHKHHHKYVLRVHNYCCDPAVNLSEQHRKSGIIVVIFGYEEARQLY